MTKPAITVGVIAAPTDRMVRPGEILNREAAAEEDAVHPAPPGEHSEHTGDRPRPDAFDNNEEDSADDEEEAT